MHPQEWSDGQCVRPSDYLFVLLLYLLAWEFWLGGHGLKTLAWRLRLTTLGLRLWPKGVAQPWSPGLGDLA